MPPAVRHIVGEDTVHGKKVMSPKQSPARTTDQNLPEQLAARLVPKCLQGTSFRTRPIAKSRQYMSIIMNLTAQEQSRASGAAASKKTPGIASPQDNNYLKGSMISINNRNMKKESDGGWFDHDLNNLYGMDESVRNLREILIDPLTPEYAEIYKSLKSKPLTGMIIYGPPGVGKTHAVHGLGIELENLGFSTFFEDSNSLQSSESVIEKRVSELFERAKTNSPSLLVIENIDAGKPSRLSHYIAGQMDKLVSGTSFVYESNKPQGNDGGIGSPTPKGRGKNAARSLPESACVSEDDSVLSGTNNQQHFSQRGRNNESGNGHRVIVVCTAQDVDKVPDELRRINRLEKEVLLQIPNEEGRRKIIEGITTVIPDPPTKSENCGNDEAGCNNNNNAEEYKTEIIDADIVPTITIADENEEKQEKRKENGIPLSSDVSIERLAKCTPGFTGGDLRLLLGEAIGIAAHRIKKLMRENPGTRYRPTVVRKDLDIALSKVKSAVTKKGFYNNVSDSVDALEQESKNNGDTSNNNNDNEMHWNGVGSLDDVKAKLDRIIRSPLIYPELYKKMGVTPKGGVLLYGPPGCGKTLIAKTLAMSYSLNFISVKGPELLSKFVGDSEKNVREVFTRARMARPCLVFFDEFDALVPQRGSGDSGGNNVTERIVNTMLTELDGIDNNESMVAGDSGNRNIFVICATNRPDIIDSALLRSGRLGTRIEIPLPKDSRERSKILKEHLKKVDNDILRDGSGNDNETDEEELLLELCSDKNMANFSGADIMQVVKEATEECIQEEIKKREYVFTPDDEIVDLIDNNSQTDLLNTSKNSSHQTSEFDGVCVRKEHILLAIRNVKKSVHESEMKSFTSSSRSKTGDMF